MPWKGNIDGHAALLHRHFSGIPHFGWGYSYGGHAIARWSRRMVKLGETVHGLVICDGVFRPVFWRAAIKVPLEVAKVESFVQKTKWPYGNKVKWGSDRIYQNVMTNTPHNAADEHDAPQAAFMRMVMEAVG